jgi:hypothetical protein
VLKHTVSSFATALLALATISLPVSAQEPSGKIKNIPYQNGAGNIVYWRTPNTQPQNMTRICLVNRTGQPKSLNWIAVKPAGKVNNLVAWKRGDRSCASIPSAQRVRFNFQDRQSVVREESMTLNGFTGDIVTFDWERDMSLEDIAFQKQVKQCEVNRCQKFVDQGVNASGQDVASGHYGPAILMCLLGCSINPN